MLPIQIEAKNADIPNDIRDKVKELGERFKNHIKYYYLDLTEDFILSGYFPECVNLMCREYNEDEKKLINQYIKYYPPFVQYHFK